MHVLVTGASGVLGRHVVQNLVARGDDVVATSRQPSSEFTRIDLTDVEHLRNLCEGIDAIVHCAADAFGKPKLVEVEGLAALRKAAPEARIVYPSIVGCDQINFSYYKVKVAAEQRLSELGGEHVIVRLTQFHEFADRLARLPVPMVFMKMRAQTLAASEAAAIVCDHVHGEAMGRVPDAGGPEVHAMVDLVKARLNKDGRRRPVLRLPVDPRAFAAGHNLCPDNRVGKITWQEHLGADSDP